MARRKEAILLPYFHRSLGAERPTSLAQQIRKSAVSIMSATEAHMIDNNRNAMFSIRQTNDGGYQIMIEPNSIAPRLPIGSPFEAVDKAKAWIDNESASWFQKFRHGV